MFSSRVGKIPWKRKCQCTPLFLLEKSQGRRSLAGYTSKGHKESNITEHTEREVDNLNSPSFNFLHTKETRIETDTCTPMFTEALFIIARTWKQPRCPSADEWIRKQIGRAHV